jgi:hypothetical protein
MTCPHLIQCAITPNQKEYALSLRQYGFPYTMLAVMMLAAPCVNKNEVTT